MQLKIAVALPTSGMPLHRPETLSGGAARQQPRSDPSVFILNADLYHTRALLVTYLYHSAAR
eukprot:3812222-Rhodomonas_salina.2